MQSGHIGKADDLYLFEPIVMSKVSCTFMCPHDLLCQYGAGIRITKTKRKLILEFKGTHDKNSRAPPPSPLLLLVAYLADWARADAADEASVRAALAADEKVEAQ